jgi:KDO2-lipid IV(A) lauroyltransferase
MASGSITARLIPAGTFVLRFLPRRVALAAAHVIADAWVVYDGARRRAIDDNLVRTAPALSDRHRRSLRRATFRHFAAIWVDFLRAPLLARRELSALVRWNTRANLEAALADRQGVVIVTAHVGALDLAGIYLAANGYAISVIVEDTAPALYGVWRRYRECTGMRVLSRRRGAVAAYRALRRGEIVALVADRVIDGPFVEVDFCGDRRVVPSGPAAFARKAGAPIVVLQITRAADGSGYELVTHPAIDPDGSTEALTQTVAAHLATMVRRFPDQWFVFDAGWHGEVTATPSARLGQRLDRGVP